MGLLRFILIVLFVIILLRLIRWVIVKIAAGLRSREAPTVRSGRTDQPRSPKYDDVQEAKFVDMPTSGDSSDRVEDEDQKKGRSKDRTSSSAEPR